MLPADHPVAASSLPSPQGSFSKAGTETGFPLYAPAARSLGTEPVPGSGMLGGDPRLGPDTGGCVRPRRAGSMSGSALVSFVPESHEGNVEGPGGHLQVQEVRSGRGTLPLGEALLLQ